MQTKSDRSESTDTGIQISRALRLAMGDVCPPGACQDCGGMTVVPDPETGAWKVCPTCLGIGQGGSA
jgi:hypothetical protein